jgi:hypothetical protein
MKPIKENSMSKWRTRALCGLAGAFVIAASASTASATATCGDLNTSGGRDAGDAVRLSLAINVGASTADCGASGSLQCGDLVKNGTLQVDDLVFMQQLLAGRTNQLLAPCTDFGTTLPCGATVPSQINANTIIPGPPACATVPSAIIDGPTFVNAGATLTVQPGAIVAGKPQPTTSGDPSVLVVARGGKINSAGLQNKPIVFTSTKAVVAGGAGGGLADWGGVELLGRGPVNFLGGTGNAEGLPLGQGIFGGNDPNDSSGVIRFTRVEFSGINITPDNELNVLTQNGVGRGTTLEFIQANAGGDDCFEWFGGTVRGRFLLATSCQDDNFDWQIGWTGGVQFGLTYQNQAINPTPVSGSNGFEADNSEFGFDLEPRSNPRMCNMTMIGTRQQPSGTGGGRAGALLRRGTAGKIYNTVLLDWTNGIQINDTATLNQACTGTGLKTTEPFLAVKNVKMFNSAGSGGDNSTGSAAGGPAGCPTADDLYNAWGTAGLIDPATNLGAGSDPQLGGVAEGTPGGITGTFPTTVDDRYFPAGGTLTSSTCGFETTEPDFFVAAPYIGAFKPGGSSGSGDNWLVGSWVNFSIQ